jgi:hypothetical protein
MLRGMATAIVALALWPAAGAFGGDDVTLTSLFVITRSKNANEVHYDARVRKDGSLDPRTPVASYWINKAEGGGRGPITFFQRFAYGHDAKQTRDGRWTLTLTAFKERTMTLTLADGSWRARAAVAGKDAYITGLFVATDESGWLPKVLYVDVSGEDAATREVIRERIVRK